MSKFFELCEAHDPANDSNPTYELYDFLKSKGINVSIVKGTDMLYIDTGTQTIPVTVNIPEEDAEDPAYNVNQEVENLASTASSGLKGLAARGLGTSAQRAKSAVKKRQGLSAKAVGLYDQKTKALEKSIRDASKKPIAGGNIAI